MRARFRAAAHSSSVHLSLAAGFSGIGTYLFLAIVARSLDEAGYSDFAVFWSLTVIAGLGLFLPIEQETSRLIVGRTSVSRGTPILRVAVVSGLAITGIGAVALILFTPVVSEFTRDTTSVSLALLLSLVGYAVQFPVRAILGATGRLSRYAVLVATEGAARLALACVVFVAALNNVLIACLVVAGASLVSLVLVKRRTLVDGFAFRVEPTRFLSGTGRLIAGGIVFQVLLNLPPVLAAGAGGDNEPNAGQVLVALTLARIPIFVYQSVQAAVLPRLARLWSRAESEFARAAALFLSAVAIVVGAWAIVMMTLGRTLTRWGFGVEYLVSWEVMGFVVFGVSLLTLALVISDTLLVTGAHASVVATWGIAAVVTAATALFDVLAPGQATLLPVIAGAGAGLLSGTALLVVRIRRQPARP